MVFSFRDSIKNARETIQHLKNDSLPPSIGDIWSIKKVILLDYYLPEFKIICSPKNKFKEWIYADPFCGSGLFSFRDKDLKNHFFPGSALLGAVTASKCGYTDCVFSEKEQENIDNLNNRLKSSSHLMNGHTFVAKKLDFEQAIAKILEMKKFGVAILVLVDPAGYIPIKWNLMEKLMKEVGIDIIFNFYTHGIARNVSTSKSNVGIEKNLNEFFGDSNWKKFRDGKDEQKLGQNLLQYYMDKVHASCKKNAIPIGVYKKGKNKLYDLIVITRSPAGTRVIEHCKKIMDQTTTENIKKEFKVQIKVQSTLFD